MLAINLCMCALFFSQVMDGSLPTSLKHIISNAEYYGPSLFLLGKFTVVLQKSTWRTLLTELSALTCFQRCKVYVILKLMTFHCSLILMLKVVIIVWIMISFFFPLLLSLSFGFAATEVVTVFVFQEPSLLSSLQDNGLTDVMLHALLIKDVSFQHCPCVLRFFSVSFFLVSWQFTTVQYYHNIVSFSLVVYNIWNR